MSNSYPIRRWHGGQQVALQKENTRLKGKIIILEDKVVSLDKELKVKLDVENKRLKELLNNA